ncbi:MAG: redoxin domain-containing protein [Verrucomicrobiales bacterium]
MKYTLTLLLFALAAIGSGQLARSAEPVSGEGLTLPTIEGKSLSPLDTGGKKAVVLFFVSPYCPTSNTFAPEMNAIHVEFDEAFAFRFVHSDTSVTPADMSQHATLMEFKAPVLNDHDQKLARLVGARITPEAVVIDGKGKVVYHGRINDLYLGPTKRQREIKNHDLRNALKAILEGRDVPIPRTEAIGCEIGVTE